MTEELQAGHCGKAEERMKKCQIMHKYVSGSAIRHKMHKNCKIILWNFMEKNVIL